MVVGGSGAINGLVMAQMRRCVEKKAAGRPPAARFPS
jgi:hypothetical protein